MGSESARNIESACDFVLELARKAPPPNVLNAIKQALVDWFAVCAAALREDRGSRLVREMAFRWNTQGHALSLYGDRGMPVAMAMINATLAHALDYDDVHLATAYHASGPTLAAALALAMHHDRTELETISAFLAGFEIGTTCGEPGFGLTLAHRGWHPTSTLGTLSAAVAASVMLRLDRERLKDAIGLACTQFAGLTLSGGTMAKPFQVGKAAMTGIMCAELAADGMTAPHDVLDNDTNGILAVLLQQRVRPDMTSLSRPWRILHNGFKAYASCQLTHAPFEAAKQLHGKIDGNAVRSIRILVNPLAPKMARYTRPSTSTESRFSISYAVALGLLGYRAAPTDFDEPQLSDSRLRHINNLVEVVSVDSIERSGAQIELQSADGSLLAATTKTALGSPDRPLGWPELEAKFAMATEVVYGARYKVLLNALRHFEEPGRLSQIKTIIEKPNLR